MDKTTKTILIILGSLLLVCVCGAAIVLATGAWSIGELVRWADNSTTEDPQEVAQIASRIADFDVPEGFTTQYGMEIASFSMVQYTTRREDTFIFVTQFPAGTHIDTNERMRQIQENSRNPNRVWYNVDTDLVEQTPVTIRGQETTLSISEGTNDQDELYRMANAEFQGNGKEPALFMIVGPVDGWDEDMLADFIASIQ